MSAIQPDLTEFYEAAERLGWMKIPEKTLRLELLKQTPQAPDYIFELLADPDGPSGLRHVARLLGVPSGAFQVWFTEKHAHLYEKAMKVKGERIFNEALDIADSATVDDVAVRKLQAEVRLKMAARLDRERWGERPAEGAGALGNLAELLQEISERKHKQLKQAQAIDVEHVEIPAPQLPESASSGAAHPPAVSTAVPEPEERESEVGAGARDR